jgi:thioredoxin-related protein
MAVIPPGAARATVRLLLALLVAWLVAAQAAVAAQRDPDAHFFQGFLGDLRAELDGARKEGKKGLVLVYEMEECPFCERLHRTVVNQADVQDYYRRHFVVLRMDIRGDATIAGFDGKEIKESDFAVKSRVRATPTTVFHGLDGRELARFSGLPKDGAEFIQLGRFVAEGHYRSGSFADFKRKPAR